MAVVANVLVRMGGGEKQIREVVIDAAGAVVSSYGKRHLFPSERWPLGFSPSSDAPTVAPLLGGRVGLLICYEGVYPELSGDWSQVDGPPTRAGPRGSGFRLRLPDVGDAGRNPRQTAPRHRVPGRAERS